MRIPVIQRLSPVLLFIFCFLSSFSQTAQINGTLKHLPNGKLIIIRPAYPFTRNHVYLGWQKITFNERGVFSVSFDLNKPEIMHAIIADSTGHEQLKYNLFLSPGNRLKMVKDESTAQFKLKISGKGAGNNQWLDIDEPGGFSKFSKDTLPARIMAWLELENEAHKKTLEAYIRKYHPSNDFIQAWKANLQYEVLAAYYFFETNNAYDIPEAYKRNYDNWFGVRQSLLKKAPLINEGALASTTYKNYLGTWLLRTKESLWKRFRTDRAGFLQEWYGKDTAAGVALFTDDNSNDFRQRIIEKYCTGKVKEFLYALLISGALGETDIKNLPVVYRNFKTQFPESEYLRLFEGPMKEMVSKQGMQLNASMKLIDSTGQFKTWAEVLAYFKGKTVLLDMWGTWCGPCRQDLDRHSALIKAHFKGRPLSYLYIANEDMRNAKAWKDLIVYFNLEGYHIMASESLTHDIMSETKQTGYPAYIIIHADGSYETFTRGMGLDREALIAQLERALK